MSTRRWPAVAGALMAMASCAESPVAPSAPEPAPPLSGYRLAWRDEFDGTSLDVTKWRPYANARRSATNTAAAVDVDGGTLTVTTYTEGGASYTGFLDTAGRYEPTYGYFEARIRFESSPGEWGAFWLQSPTMGNPLGDPGRAGTEIDIAEHRVRTASGADIRNSYNMALHWDGYAESHKSASATGRPPAGAPPLHGQWHVYALLWTPERYTFYLDGVEQWTTVAAVSHRGELIRLTCEVEDGAWAGNVPPGGYGPKPVSTTRMQVDWVRVWQRPGP